MDEPPLPEATLAQVKTGPLPRHVGIIMDGNGRWAELRAQSRISGHRAGTDSVRAVTRCARQAGIEALTLYAFSAQNWFRPVDEVEGLMGLLCEYLERERAEVMQNNVRLNAIGQLDRLPDNVRQILDRLRADSAKNTGMVLTLALSYGGREELLHAAREVALAIGRGELVADDVCESDFERHLWTMGLPPVDLVIRTSGEQRVSNFLLWQGAYAEYVFVDTLWPDFREAAFLRCVAEFQRRERRFGKTSAQVAGQLPK
ncbi:MAG: isoprenyl transferase [Myxococcaceae bacterium]